jgi:hypothetical protein
MSNHPEAPVTPLDEMSTRQLIDSPFKGNPEAAFKKATEIVLSELGVQMRMWGTQNERADASDREMMCAAMAQLDLVALKGIGGLRSREAVKVAHADFYPKNWDGFRDYGTDVANLGVAGAYLISEIARKLIAGEDFERAPRPTEQSYPAHRNNPNVSSAEAIAEQARV